MVAGTVTLSLADVDKLRQDIEEANAAKKKIKEGRVQYDGTVVYKNRKRKRIILIDNEVTE